MREAAGITAGASPLLECKAWTAAPLLLGRFGLLDLDHALVLLRALHVIAPTSKPDDDGATSSALVAGGGRVGAFSLALERALRAIDAVHVRVDACVRPFGFIGVRALWCLCCDELHVRRGHKHTSLTHIRPSTKRGRISDKGGRKIQTRPQRPLVDMRDRAMWLALAAIAAPAVSGLVTTLPSTVALRKGRV